MLKPQENTKYTFMFRKKGSPKAHAYTLVYVGTNQKGRLMFLNVTTGTFTAFTAGYVSNLLRRHTVAAVPLAQSAAPGPTDVGLGAGESAVGEKETFEVRTIRTLRGLSEVKAVSVLARIGYPAEELADKLERILKDEKNVIPQDEVNAAFLDLMKANDVIEGRVNPLQISFPV